MDSTSKLKIGNTEDRISSLQDELLCQILSFLPSKDALRTSILSIRTKYVWTSIPNLDFDDAPIFTIEKLNGHVGRTCFMNFVDRVLNLHKTCAIKKFRLKCGRGYDLSHIDEWICSAIKQNVQHLDLAIFTEDEVLLPQSLFTCGTLEVLKLNFSIIFDIPSEAHLPKLRVVHLDAVLFQDSNSVQRLISTCPILEELVIIKSRIDDLEACNVCAPTLKRLTIACLIDDEDLEADCECTFFVNAPTLEYFELADTAMNHYNITNLSTLVEAKIDIYFDVEKAFEVLNWVLMVKSLSLSYFMLEVLIECNKDIPVFHKLVHLDLALLDFQLELVQPLKHSPKRQVMNNLLESSPNLEALVINAEYLYLTNWSPPQCVPRCLELHLEALEIRGFEGQEDDMILVSYFLENAKVLKKLTLVCGGLYMEEELNVIQKLSSVRRASEACQINIS